MLHFFSDFSFHTLSYTEQNFHRTPGPWINCIWIKFCLQFFILLICGRVCESRLTLNRRCKLWKSCSRFYSSPRTSVIYFRIFTYFPIGLRVWKFTAILSSNACVKSLSGVCSISCSFFSIKTNKQMSCWKSHVGRQAWEFTREIVFIHIFYCLHCFQLIRLEYSWELLSNVRERRRRGRRKQPRKMSNEMKKLFFTLYFCLF